MPSEEILKQEKFLLNLPYPPPTLRRLFKIVSAGALIENFSFNEDTLFSYNGRGTTLYKYQLKDRKNRWTRTIPLKKAFAYSNNVVFGKLGIKYLNDDDIYSMARRFGFGRKITQALPLGESTLMPVKDSYDLAEISSGFNRETKPALCMRLICLT